MVALLFDIAYLLVLAIASPWLLYKAWRTGKYGSGLAAKFFGSVPIRAGDRPCVWFHAVSVGEVLMLRRVVRALAAERPGIDMVVSTSTHSGMEVARQHFTDCLVCYFPLDFSWAVDRAFCRLRPDVVALAELELWPNFIAAARRHGVRVAVINGRMSPRSHRGYRRIRPIMRHFLAQIDAFAVQTAEFAERFRDAGAPPNTVAITGSVKYDGVETDRDNPATGRLRRLLGLNDGELVWVAGSTSEPEEQIVLDAYEQVQARYPRLRLIVVPRHKERFDEVGELIRRRGHELVRRSRLQDGANAGRGVFLIDTIGELSAVWGLAEVAFVGGTFAPRGGQNMIEPAGYGAAVVFGPGVWNFQDTVNHLLACHGAIQVNTGAELTNAVDRLLSDSQQRARLGDAARRFVLSQNGATDRTIRILGQLLPSDSVDSARRAA